MEIHAPPTGVHDPGGALRVGLRDGDFEARGQGSTGAGGGIVSHFSDGVATFVEIPVMDAAPIADERAVADHLGVQASGVGVIDFLRPEAVENGADRGGGLVGMKGESGRGVLRGSDNGEGKDRGEGQEAGKRFLWHPVYLRKYCRASINALLCERSRGD